MFALSSGRRRMVSVIASVGLLMAGTVALAPSPALASQRSDPGPANQLPNVVPSAISPAVNDGRVFAIAENGNKMIIGGSFTQVGGVSHTSVAVFDKTSGALTTTFAPTVNGDVNAVLPGPTTNTVYIGGTFTQVNGVAAQFLTELDMTTGAIVSTFKPPAFNYGYVNDMVARGNRLYVAGTFTVVGGKTHGGLVALNTTSGALDPFVDVQFTGHHNDTGKGAQGWVGPWDIDVTADGNTMAVIGNFKYANGQLRDQVALIDLSGSSAQLAPWATTRYSPQCYNNAYDSDVRGVSFSPDGSYFVVNATGGGNRTLCDATTRWATNLSDTNAQPTWVDETGGDTVWGITVTNTAIYIGGHNRWNNNPNGVDQAQAGAVPRPGLAALDPVSGRPYLWNPGRKPLGVAVFAVYASSAGLWIGSNTDYIGNYTYNRPKLAYFPYAGGATPTTTTTATLPATVNLASTTSGLTSVAFDGTHATATAADNQGIDFANWRGAFQVGNKVFYGYTDGYLYSRTVSGSTLGAATKIDPYDDPTWSTVESGDGTTFQGKVPSLYGQLGSVTSMFYSAGRLYYTLAGNANLYSRWFNPDSGIVDETTTTVPSTVSFSTADGMFVSGSTLYYASADGILRSVPFSGGAVTGTPTVVNGPTTGGINWANRVLFLTPGAANVPPTAAFTSSCTNLNCSFDATGSKDTDGTISSYVWDFGDNQSATGASPTHAYSTAGTYTVKLTVTDNGGGTATVSHTITAAPTAHAIAFVAAANGGGGNATSKNVTVPTAAHAGDTALLFLTQTSTATWAGPNGPTGWTKVGTYANSTLVTTAWTKTLGASDVGATVNFTSSAATHASADLAVYSGVDTTTPIARSAQGLDTAKASHTTPTVTADAGDWVVSFWADRSTATRTWTTPAAVTARDKSTDTGSLTTQAVIADSSEPVAAGSYGGLTATTDASTDRSVAWTLELNTA